ncbi:hypothetical protein BGZ60DRAFT_545642 [Tricladium varicosporioides]|nr:hypothetical protein BGZ60DRAFT_545642 [Hymenoscyphus varicosporioides]
MFAGNFATVESSLSRTPPKGRSMDVSREIQMRKDTPAPPNTRKYVRGPIISPSPEYDYIPLPSDDDEEFKDNEIGKFPGTGEELQPLLGGHAMVRAGFELCLNRPQVTYRSPYELLKNMGSRPRSLSPASKERIREMKDKVLSRGVTMARASSPFGVSRQAGNHLTEKRKLGKRIRCLSSRMFETIEELKEGTWSQQSPSMTTPQPSVIRDLVGPASIALAAENERVHFELGNTETQKYRLKPKFNGSSRKERKERKRQRQRAQKICSFKDEAVRRGRNTIPQAKEGSFIYTNQVERWACRLFNEELYGNVAVPHSMLKRRYACEHLEESIVAWIAGQGGPKDPRVTWSIYLGEDEFDWKRPEDFIPNEYFKTGHINVELESNYNSLFGEIIAATEALEAINSHFNDDNIDIWLVALFTCSNELLLLVTGAWKNVELPPQVVNAFWRLNYRIEGFEEAGAEVQFRSVPDWDNLAADQVERAHDNDCLGQEEVGHL